MSVLLRCLSGFLLAFCLTGLSVAAVDQNKVLRVALGEAPENFNVLNGVLAISSFLHLQLFLTFRDAEGDVRWGLLDRWEVSEEGLVYTLHLREDVPWSDGRLLEAADAVAAIRYQFRNARLLVETLYANIAVKEVQGKQEPMVRLLDRLSFEITLSRPDPLFPDRLSLSSATAVRQDKLDQFGDDKWYLPENLLTLAPFRLAESDLPHSVVLEKNAGFPGADSLYWERIHISFLPRQEQRLRALQMGEFDLVFLDDTSGSMEWSGPGDLIRAGFPSSRFIFIHPSGRALANPLLREALALLADPATLTPRESPLERPLYALVPAGLDKAYTSRDVPPSGSREQRFQRAGQLLESLGYSPEKPLKLRLRVLDIRSNRLPAERFKRIAERYGVELELIFSSTDVHYKAFFKGNYDLAIIEWFPGMPFAEDQMTPFLQSNSSLLQHGYANPVYLSTLEKMKRETTKAGLYRGLHVLEDTLMGDRYVLPFSQFLSAYVVGPRIRPQQTLSTRLWLTEPARK